MAVNIFWYSQRKIDEYKLLQLTKENLACQKDQDLLECIEYSNEAMTRWPEKANEYFSIIQECQSLLKNKKTADKTMAKIKLQKVTATHKFLDDFVLIFKKQKDSFEYKLILSSLLNALGIKNEFDYEEGDFCYPFCNTIETDACSRVLTIEEVYYDGNNSDFVTKINKCKIFDNVFSEQMLYDAGFMIYKCDHFNFLTERE